MSKIIADQSFVSQLNGGKSPMEICDAAGKIVGHFVPSEVYHSFMHEIMDPPDLTPEELERRFAEGGGKSLAQIWKELGRQ